ncbi:M81 family metallopeptidase [Pseudomonas sp. S2_B07]
MTGRILIAGFQHETNTFAPSKAHYSNFERGEGFPQMARGVDVLAMRDINLPIGGFILEAEKLAYELIPVIWAGASPSAHVTEDAFERISEEILAAARRERFDAVYLDLHGAMVAEHVDDGEGTLLKRLRDAVGPHVPIIASLDLHANMTELMFANSDALVAFRTYPHVDMAATGAKAAGLLSWLLDNRRELKRVSKRLPFLIPINSMCTLLEPALGVYEQLEVLENAEILSLSFAPGFPAADFPECGPVVWGYGRDEAAVERAVQQLYQKIVDEESRWKVEFLSPDDSVIEAMRLAASADRPVVIADTQDNPGAGGDSNTMGMLRALLKQGATQAAIGLIFDPAAAQMAHRAGIGASLVMELGGQSMTPGDAPLAGRFEVIFLSDGCCQFDGPMMNGMRVDVGPAACLKIEGVLVGVSSGKTQMLDRNLYRMVGIEPEKMKILVNKSSVHFRADFQAMAHAVLVAKAPGPMIADPADLPWKNLAPGLRTSPLGQSFDKPA